MGGYILAFMAYGRSRLKVNISPLPVTDNLENLVLNKAPKMSQKNRNKIFRSNHNAFKNQRKKLTDKLTVLTKKVTLQVRSKTHSNKTNKQNK